MLRPTFGFSFCIGPATPAFFTGQFHAVLPPFPPLGAFPPTRSSLPIFVRNSLCSCFPIPPPPPPFRVLNKVFSQDFPVAKQWLPPPPPFTTPFNTSSGFPARRRFCRPFLGITNPISFSKPCCSEVFPQERLSIFRGFP